MFRMCSRLLVLFVCFKQKTAYEMRIGDWSSDVCSSDLFPNNRQSSACMSATTINRALERMGFGGKLSGHGFRGTASTILHELGVPSHLIELQLAHKDRNSVRASYNHAAYLSARAELMQLWANHFCAMRD